MRDDRPIRVVHVIARLNVGGPAAIIETLHAHASPGFRHLVVAGAVADNEAEWASFRGAGVRRVVQRSLTSQIAPLRDVAALAGLSRTLRALAPDIVHTHTAKAGLLGRPAARLAGVPAVVHTFHGHVLNGYFGPRTTAAYTQAERWLAPLTDRLLTVGARVGTDLLDAGVGRASQYRTVTPGVVPMAVPPQQQAREQLGLAADIPVLAFVGRLTAIKRPDRLPLIMQKLDAAGVRPTLLIAGDGELRAELEISMARLGDRVRFMGWTGDVATVLAAADLLMLTSDNEGMPITLIEAATAGLPAVAADVGSVAEVVQDGLTGRVVPPRVADLAMAVAEMLADPGRRVEMGTAAMVHAAAHFSPATLVSQHEAIYREVLT